VSLRLSPQSDVRSRLPRSPIWARLYQLLFNAINRLTARNEIV
jgi:hypothetical protein